MAEERHGRGAAWAWHAVCESAFTGRNTLGRCLYLKQGWLIAPYVGGAEHRRKPQPMFCVSAKLWLPSDMHTWVPSPWTQRMLGAWVWWPSGTSVK